MGIEPIGVGTNYETSVRWNDIDIGASHAIGIRTDGTLWAWGENSYGQLGQGDISHRVSMVQIGSDTNWSKLKIGANSRSDGRSFAIKTDGSLWAWGLNTNGELGLGDKSNRSSPVQIGVDYDWNEVLVTLYISHH